VSGPAGAEAPLRGRHVAILNWRDLDHEFAGGSEVYAWEMASAFREAGARVEFLTARDRHQSAHEVRDGIDIHRGGGPFTFYAWVARALLARRRTLDLVVDAEAGIPQWAPLFVGRRTEVVLLLHHVHQQQFSTHFSFPMAQVGRFLERVVMRRVYRGRRTLAVSESTRREMREQLGWQGPVQILQNGAFLPVPGAVRSEDKDPHRVLVLGRLVAHKRVGLVIRAFARLAATRPELHLDICGRGPDSQALSALVEERGLADRVTLHGYLPEADKAGLMRRAALHVCASDMEGWGQVVIEAAGWGVPTIARDVAGLRDSISDGVTGWLVPDSTDPGELEDRVAARLESALMEVADPARRAQYVAACEDWAARFSWTRMREEALQLAVDELGSRQRVAG
jgi:glycosyltransferase involved in cell wall biosynthesis